MGCLRCASPFLFSRASTITPITLQIGLQGSLTKRELLAAGFPFLRLLQADCTLRVSRSELSGFCPERSSSLRLLCARTWRKLEPDGTLNPLIVY